MRQTTRAGKLAHVGDELDSMRLQKPNELLDLPRRMANRPDAAYPIFFCNLNAHNENNTIAISVRTASGCEYSERLAPRNMIAPADRIG